MRIAIALALALSFSAAASGEPLEGRYRVDGSDQAGATYAGEVTITASGAHFRVEGTINGETGSAIALQQGEAVAVLDESGTLTLFTRGTDGALTGRWVVRGGDGTVTAGEETWRRVRDR